MKKINKYTVCALALLIGGVSLISLAGPQANVLRSIASSDSDKDEPTWSFRDGQYVQTNEGHEMMSEEDRLRKISVCGAGSLDNDSIENFSANPSGWFSGYAKVLSDPHEALLAKAMLIQKAKVSIDLSTYIFSTDESSNAYLSLLRDAIKRGVNVRVMVDEGGSLSLALKDQYSHLRSLLLAEKQFREQGLNPGKVYIVNFHPIFSAVTMTNTFIDRFIDKVPLSNETAFNVDRRSHDKILIIDRENRADTMAIVGGRNIDNSYYGFPQVDEKTYEDMEVLVKDDPSSTNEVRLSNTIGKHFDDLFCSKGNRWLSLTSPLEFVTDDIFQKAIALRTSSSLSDLDGAFDELLEKGNLYGVHVRMKGKSGFDFLENGFEKSNIMGLSEIQNLKRRVADVLVDPDAEFKDSLVNGDSIYYNVRRIIGHAKKTVDICTPYIFLPKNERDCLKEWVMEEPGRKLRVISNSAATSDSVLAMATFDKETAPDLMNSSDYECHYLEKVGDHHVEKILKGHFDNSDHKVEVYELGRLDNKLFKGEIINGKPAEASAYYGKLHAKFGIIDGQYSFVGSDNLDERSRHLNSETAVFIDSKAIGANLTKDFDVLAERSSLYGSPELNTMMGLKEVQTHVREMEVLEKIFKNIPQSAFAN